MKSKWKLPVILGCIISLSGCGISNQPVQKTASEQKSSTAEENVRTGSWESAAQSPYGAYPELVTYTLGQMSGTNNSNLPDGNTYEDNAYTRYLKKILNIQNENIYMESEDRYDEFVNILIKDQTLPDVLVISDRGMLKELVGSTSSSYSVDPVFDKFGSSPRKWINQNGEIVYGSVTEETRNALSYLHELYERGVLDQNFALRAQNNLRDLVVSGKCGAFFGLWWTPNNPLMDIYETDKDAEWMPYYLQEVDWKNVYASFSDSKYVVVRKGYEHPEIVMKIISVLFDYSRYTAEDADEVNEYFALNVDPTARPLVINVDYNEATFQITKDILAVMSGQRQESTLSEIAKSYYDAAEKYIHGESEIAEDWAAYESRLVAVGRLLDGNYRSVKSKYLDDSDGEVPKSLLQLEKNSFIQIIMGVKPVSYFDEFVETWYEEGGEELTQQIRKSNSGK